MTGLRDKTALVTGASRGLGRATALALSRDGAHVIVHYGKASEEAGTLVDEIRSAGGTATSVQADLALPESPEHLAERVNDIAHGRLDIFVANAGISGSATIEQQTIAHFDSLFAVNVRAPYFLVQQLLPLFGEGSSIVFVSSLAAGASVGDLSAYASTKGAIGTIVRHFASALGPKGIRVNAVAPGVIATDMSSFTKTDAGRSFALGIQALKRIGQPEDVADVVRFLASNDARWITGTTIHVDGGSKL